MGVPNHYELAGGITCIDTGYCRPELAACYLVMQGDQAALVDTGTAHSISGVLELLAAKRIPLANVAYVIPTHVHLDHAGGAGELMRQLPAARLVVHPRGARHMIDPGKLAAGAMAVYGETAFRKSFGELVPVAQERVVIAEDDFVLDFNGRRLRFLDTPGHAKHHNSIFDEATRGFFTGDSFGLSYRELDCAAGAFVLPTTSPVQFDPDAWHASLDRLLSFEPERMYLTHFGMVTDVDKLARDLRRRVDRHVEIARNAASSPDRHGEIKRELAAMLVAEVEAMGGSHGDEALRLFEFDLELNAQGLEVWLDGQEK